MKKENRKKISTEDLAVMVARGFSSMEGKMEGKFEKLENNLSTFKTETEDNFKKIRNDILNMGDKFVPRHEFDTLLIRVGRLEQRVQEKAGK